MYLHVSLVGEAATVIRLVDGVCASLELRAGLEEAGAAARRAFVVPVTADGRAIASGHLVDSGVEALMVPLAELLALAGLAGMYLQGAPVPDAS